MHDTIIRPYAGDLLVVILIYCAVKSFMNMPIIATASGVLLFSYLVEISQYFDLIKLLGWQNSVLAQLVLGSSYSWIDMLLYTIGFVIIIVFENIRSARTSVLKI